MESQPPNRQGRWPSSVAKGLLLDFESVARPAGGDPLQLLREIQNLGYEVYWREFVGACDYVMYVDSPRKGLDSAERFLETVFEELDQKPTRTEIMSLAPVFAELHRHALYDDVVRALPGLAKGRKVAIVSSLPPFLVAQALEPVKSYILAVAKPIGLRPVFIRRQSDASCSHAVATIPSFEELEAALRPPAKPAPTTVKAPETSAPSGSPTTGK